MRTRDFPARSLLIALCGIVVALYASVVIAFPDKFFAEDSYLYFQVAWNFARGAGSTFNNFMPTNGYHPLWMLICAFVFKLLPDKAAAVHGIAAAICIFNVLLLFVVWRLLARIGCAAWWAAYLLLIPFSFLSQLGTEGSLSAFLLALFALQAYRFACVPTGRTAFWCHLAGALAVLARLDNIFIVTCIWLALLVTSSPTYTRRLRLQFASIPVYLVLWGSYLFSNEYYFHVLEPISGMMKTTGQEPHKLFSNFPPHTPWIALGVILPCLAYLAFLKRDLFFSTVELPFTIGVLCHGAYIAFRMSYETRWSWYFTSWILLASILLARVASDLISRFFKESALKMESVFAYASIVFLALLWVKGSLLKYTRMAESGHSPAFEEAVANQAGIHSALAFDYPGRFGYYSGVRIIPLDGLMGNMDFQHQLLTEGVVRYVAEHHIDGFIGPSLPLDDSSEKAFCESIHNGATKFTCVPIGPHQWDVRSVDVYSRIPHAYAGSLPLNDADVVWTKPGMVSVWRLHPEQLAEHVH